MSQRSDDLITEVAKVERKNLEQRVVIAAKNWLLANQGVLATTALENAVREY